LAYNRDLQEDKPPVFDAFDTVHSCLELAAPLVAQTEINRPAVEERLALLQRLGKKYGGSVEAMLRRTEELRKELNEAEDVGMQEKSWRKPSRKHAAGTLRKQAGCPDRGGRRQADWPPKWWEPWPGWICPR